MDGLVEEGWRGERRVRLLDAAARVFSRVSYDQASMDEIAQEAGVGKPTLYRYFPSKDELFAAVFVEVLDALDRRLARVLDRERGVAAQIRGLVLALIPTFRDHLVTGRMLDEGAAAIDRSNRRVFRDRRARVAEFLAHAIERGIAEGEVRWSADAHTTAHLVIGMIWSGAAAIQASDEAIADEITAVVLTGIGDATSRTSAAAPSPERRESRDPEPRSSRSREATSR